MSKICINYAVLLLIIFFVIFKPKLFYISNRNTSKNIKDNNIYKFNNNISINKTFDIFNLEEILSNDPFEINKNDNLYELMKNNFKIKNIHIEPINYENSENKMEECFKYYSSFDRIIYKEINKKSTNIIDEKNKNIPEFCKKIFKKLYESINEIEDTHFLEDEEESININFDIQNGVIDYNLDIKSFLLDTNNELNELKKKKAKNTSNIKDNYDDELEQYYKKSRKDCVEYGLKSLNEEYIVCTKYE